MENLKGIFFKDFENSYIPHILLEMYIQRIYAPYIEGKKGLTILDIGGNVGLFTLYASPFAKKIHTVEPAQEHVDVIKYMTEYNKIDDKVEVHRLAIAGKNGEMTLNHNTNVTMFSLSDAVKDPSLKGETVTTVTMDKFLEDNKIEHVDFAKIDVEGEEMNIICGSGFEKASKAIDSLIVEWHQWTGRNPSQMVTALQDYGYEVTPIPSNATLFGARKVRG